MTDWQKIKSEFIAGAKLKDLAEKYQISIETLKTRHRRNRWADERTKNERKMNEKTHELLASKQAGNNVKEAYKLQKIANKIEIELDGVEAGSKEGLVRALVEIYKVKGTYTGKTIQKTETEHNVKSDTLPTILKQIYEIRSSNPRV